MSAGSSEERNCPAARRTTPTRGGSVVSASTGKTYMLVGSAACTSGDRAASRRPPRRRPGCRRRSARRRTRPGGSRCRAAPSSCLASPVDRERRRGVVGQHDRPVTPAAALGEVDLVGVRPAGGELGTVVHQPGPVAGPVVAVLGNGREQERQPRRAGRRAGERRRGPGTSGRRGRRATAARGSPCPRTSPVSTLTHTLPLSTGVRRWSSPGRT